MKYVKMLGLLAVAAAALMAFVGTASATIIKDTSGATYTSTIKAEAGATTLDAPFGSVTCQKSHVEGKVEQHGAGVTVKGKVSRLEFTECGEDHVTVLKNGSLEIHAVATTGDGTLTSTGAEVTVVDGGTGVHCIYTTNNTDIGYLTGSNRAGHPTAVLHINNAIPRTGGDFFCGSSGTWTGTYTVVTPDYLAVH